MKILYGLFAVASSLGLGWGVYQYSFAAANNDTPPVTKQPIAVEVMVAGRRPIEDRSQLVGSLSAGTEVQVISHRNGYIMQLPVDVGDRIQAGDVIVELDDREQQELAAGARAALVVAEAQKKSALAQEDLALTNLNRQKRLAEQDASTKQSLEQAEAQWNIAVAQRELEEARVKQAQSEVDHTLLAVNDSKIHAPMTGYVGERFVDVGDLAKPDVPLLRIVSFDTVRTVVHVVEKDYPRVKVGQDATIQVDAFPHREFQGKVIRKAPVLNPNTRTAAVQIEIPNSDRKLKPGMHARVSLLFERRSALVLPVAALVDQNDKPTVFIVESDPPAVKRKEVRTGINDGEFVEILSGLSAEDRVVTMGNRLVKTGQVVEPVQVPWTVELSQDVQIAEQESEGPAAATTGE